MICSPLISALVALSDVNGGTVVSLLLTVVVNVDGVALGYRLPSLSGLLVLVDHNDVVITGLLRALLLLLVLVEDDVLLHLVTGGVVDITRPRVTLNLETGYLFPPDLAHLVFVDEVVTGEVLLGLQSHQLVVVADSDAGLGPRLILITVRELI